MTGRGRRLRGVAGISSRGGGLRWGGLVAPNGAEASGSGSESHASGDSDGSTDAGEGDPTGLPGYTVGQIYLRYEEHVGITTFVEVENQTESGERVYLKADARGPDDTLGTDKTWETIPATFDQSVKLRIDNVFDLYNAVDNITELVIYGRVPDGKNGVIAAFSGSRFQTGIESDGPTKPDGGTDAAVRVQQEGANNDPTKTPTDSGDNTASEDSNTGEQTGAAEGQNTTADTAGETDTPGVDDPSEVVDVGTGGEETADGGTTAENDGGSTTAENDSGGGLLETLSFGIFGG